MISYSNIHKIITDSIKIDIDNFKYFYTCSSCGQKWRSFVPLGADEFDKKPCMVDGAKKEEVKVWSPTILDTVEVEKESVIHPPHYNHGVYEVIDVIHDWDLSFNLGNVVKYIARCGHKVREGKEKDDMLKDLQKAMFYLKDEIGRLEGKEKSKEIQ